MQPPVALYSNNQLLQLGKPTSSVPPPAAAAAAASTTAAGGGSANAGVGSAATEKSEKELLAQLYDIPTDTEGTPAYVEPVTPLSEPVYADPNKD